MLIPNNYLLEEGKEAPEGTTVVSCRVCGNKFALPADVAEKVGNTDVCDKDECREVVDKEAAAAAHALMKSDTTKEVDNTINTALGK